MEAFFVILIGLATGSYLNVVIKRLGKKDCTQKRSFCFVCKQQLRWYDLVPLVSYVCLKGRCRYCKESFGLNYFVVELLYAVLVYSLYALYGLGFTLILYGLIFALLLVLAVYDALTQYVSTKIVIFSVIAIFVTHIYLGTPWQYWFFGGLIGSLFFLVQYLISKGRWIGFGDVYIGLCVGMLVGVIGSIVALFLAYTIGAVYALMLIAFKKVKLQEKIAFGPFIIGGGVLSFFFAQQIIEWYVRLPFYLIY